MQMMGKAGKVQQKQKKSVEGVCCGQSAKAPQPVPAAKPEVGKPEQPKR